MAETFLFNITERVLSNVTLLDLDEISLAWNIKTDLKKLENTLSTVKAVLMDAGKQQAKNHEVKDWLEKLQDVVYDVDDLLDGISTQVLRRKAGVNGSMLKQKHAGHLNSTVMSSSRLARLNQKQPGQDLLWQPEEFALVSHLFD